MRGKSLFMFFVVLGLVAGVDISTCQEISSAGTYMLTGDMQADVSPCITVSADDVVLDCDGNTLNSNTSSYVLVEVSADNFEMRNCNLEDGEITMDGNNLYIVDTEIKNVQATMSGDGIRLKDLDFEDSSTLVQNSQDVNITGSDFSGGTDQLTITNSANLLIRSTDFSKGEKGLVIDDASTGITVEQCKFREDTVGAEISSSAAITGSTFENNGKGLVIDDGCDVYGNEFVENTEYAIVVEGEDNTVYDNKFEGNNKDVDVSDTNNYFNIEKNCDQVNIIGGNCQGGNYWDKYAGYDSDGDGFGEEPYEVDSGVYDELPLTNFIDQRAPSVYLDEPTEGEVLNSRTVLVKYRAFDDVSVAQCWAILDGVEEQISRCVKQYELEDVSDGEHTLTVRVADLAGKTDEESVNFKVDATKPTLEVDSPEQDAEYVGEVQVYFAANDANSIECFYKIDSGEEKKITGCDDFKITNLTAGQHRITIRVMDEAGNNETEYRDFKFTPTIPEMDVEYSMKCPENELEVDVYADGQKLDGVDVELKKRIQPGKFSSIGKKQYNGLTVSFRILEAGEYVISASKQGYKEYEELINLEKCAVESSGPPKYIAPPEEEKKEEKPCLGTILLFSLLGIGIMLIKRGEYEEK